MGKGLKRFAVWAAFLFLVACGNETASLDPRGAEEAPSSISNPQPSFDGEAVTSQKTAAGQTFDLNLSLQLGILCLQSYQMLDDFNAGKTFTLPAPYTLVKIFYTEEPYEGENFSDQVPIAFIATEGSAIYVVFRGTDTIVEWIKDAELAQIPYGLIKDGGLTEEGFTTIYAGLHASLVQTIADLQQSGNYDTLYVTGHSLGGALAVLSAPALKQDTAFAKPILYTFAGPRAGNVRFAEETYASRIETSFRVVNTNDIVPTLPPAFVVVYENGDPKYFFYEHVNAENDITFGQPISGPTDFKDIENNHEMCNYYDSLCGETEDPSACMQQASGIHGCNTQLKVFRIPHNRCEGVWRFVSSRAACKR